jgi:hypothetical protein
LFAGKQPEPAQAVEVFGLASGVHFKCVCGFKASLRPDVVPESRVKVESLPVGSPFQNRLNSGDFEINRRFQLGLQLCGSGRHNGGILGGMLKLNVNPMRKRWTEIQENLVKSAT